MVNEQCSYADHQFTAPSSSTDNDGGVVDGRASYDFRKSHAYQDYQMQLMLLEQQNKKRLLQARADQEHPVMSVQQKPQGLPEAAQNSAHSFVVSEKHLPNKEVPHHPHFTRRDMHRRPAWRVIARFSLACLLVIALLRPSLWPGRPTSWLVPRPSVAYPASDDTTAPVFAWDDIPTLPDLDYVPCYNGYYCARLELPLDYFNGSTDKTISLAVIKWPATVGVDDSRYKGPILINPGGPSGSGVEFAFRSGPTLQSVVQGDFPPTHKERHYDIVSFDPRGVGLTLPRVECSDGSVHSQSWRLRILEEGTLTSSDASLGRQWAMMQAASGRCSDVEEYNIQHYLSTVSVARDMLELVEASARWRQKQLRKLGSTIMVKPKDEKLQYWGFSYGSYLGNSFAALHPDRVGRLIVDGVVDAYDYSRNQWFDNLVDTEKDMDLFYYHCARVGHPACPLAESKHPSPQKVKVRTAGIISRLWHHPLAVTHPYADIVSWSDVRNLVFATLYSPVPGFPFLANVLAELEVGKTDLLAGLLGYYHQFSCPAGVEAADAFRNASFHFRANDPFTQSAILCADGDAQQWMTRDIFEQHIINTTALSPTLGDVWSAIKLPCIGYTLRPLHRFPGPFIGETSHPLLMIGNTADPVTPLGAAKKMAKGFKGAVALTQDSPGHCSLSAYSSCTLKYIHEYFFNGTLPAKGTVCAAESVPWGPGPGDVDLFEEVRIASDMHAQIGKTLYEVGGGFGNPLGFGRLDVTKMFK